MPTLHLDILDSVRIASPCGARWEDMTGDERSRRCARCDLMVHNLSDMTREEARAFVLAQAGPDADNPRRVCARYFQRADGTIMTRDCPVGLGIVRARARAAAGRMVAAVTIAAGSVLGAALAANPTWDRFGWSMQLRELGPVQWVSTRLQSRPAFSRMGQMVMGKVIMPTNPIPPDTDGQNWGPRPHLR